MWVDAERAPALEEITRSFKEDTGIEVKLAVKDFAAVRDDFDEAAGLLEDYGMGLEPQELDALRTRLEPVDLWIDRRCAS